MCQCDRVANAFYFNEAPTGFMDSVKRIDSGDWVGLFRCEDCGAHWSIDEWDKYQWQVAVRVETVEGWRAASEEQRKMLLLETRGGEDTGTCIWSDCDRPRVKGVAYCIDHLYDTGARR